MRMIFKKHYLKNLKRVNNFETLSYTVVIQTIFFPAWLLKDLT